MAELHALKKHWKSMIDAISEDDVSGINHYLYGKKVYGSKERDAIDSKQTASEKMSKVLKAAEKKIKGDPTAFEILLQALREESSYSYLANKLKRTRDEYYSSCSDESEEETDESSDDDVSDVQEVVEQPRKRSRGPGKSGKKRVKKESRPVPPSVRTRKSGDKRNGGSNRRKPKGSSSSKATAQASSKNGSESRNGSSGSSSALGHLSARLQCEMETPCEDIHFAKISTFISTWETIAPLFGITPEEEMEIKRDNAEYGLQKRSMLRKWKSKNGNAATYQKLFDLFTEGGQNDIAHRIRDEIVRGQQTARRVESDSSEPGNHPNISIAGPVGAIHSGSGNIHVDSITLS